MAKSKAPGGPQIMEAVHPFVWHGLSVSVGNTVVAGHPLVAGREQFFRPFTPTFGELPEAPEEAPGQQPEQNPEAIP